MDKDVVYVILREGYKYAGEKVVDCENSQNIRSWPVFAIFCEWVIKWWHLYIYVGRTIGFEVFSSDLFIRNLAETPDILSCPKEVIITCLKEITMPYLKEVTVIRSQGGNW